MRSYYLCAHGSVCRTSNKVECSEAAAIYCFGITSDVTILPIGNSKFASLSAEKQIELIERLRKEHRRKTGNEFG